MDIMSEEPKEASEESPDELVFDLQGVLEDSMTDWQQAHAFEDMARMTLILDMKAETAAFTIAQVTILHNLYEKMMSKQSAKVKELMEKHLEDIRKGRDVQYDRIRPPWEALQQMEEHLKQEVEREQISQLPEMLSSQYSISVTPGHPETCACYACEDIRQQSGV